VFARALDDQAVSHSLSFQRSLHVVAPCYVPVLTSMTTTALGQRTARRVQSVTGGGDVRVPS
jgi:hypothetical protein